MMRFFDYNDSLFHANTENGNDELEMEKCFLAFRINRAVIFYNTHLGPNFKESNLLLNIDKIMKLHTSIHELIDILVSIDKKNNINSFDNKRLLKLVDSLLINSLEITKKISKAKLTKFRDENNHKYDVNFFEKEIDFCIMYIYKKDFDSLIAFNKKTTELGALMGVYDMLFGNNLLELNKKYTTKYIFEMLKINL